MVATKINDCVTDEEKVVLEGLGLEYFKIKQQLDALEKEKDTLGNKIKSILPVGNTYIFGDVIIDLKQQNRSSTDYKMVKTLVEEQVGEEVTNNIWNVATTKKAITMLSVKVAN